MKTKFCFKCSTEKSISEFGNRGGSRSHLLNSYCKTCTTQLTVAWAKENSESVKLSQRKYQVKRKYGLEWDEYLKLIENGCGVCGSIENLCVDHDHSCCPGGITCGKCVRGVLCNRHNKVLGYVSDSIEELQASIAYLTRTE